MASQCSSSPSSSSAPSSLPVAVGSGGDPPEPAFDRRHAWLVTLMIVTFMIINFADKSVLGLAAVPIMHELDISNSTYGLISSSFSILFNVSGLVVGFFSARISSRVLLFAMCLVWGVAQLPVLIWAAVPTLIAGRMLLGLAEGPATSMSMHALYKWFPADRRGLPSALQIGGAALGTLIAAPVVTWLITAFGWRSAFAALAVASLVWSAIWWRVGHDGPYGQTPAPKAERSTPVRQPTGNVPYRKLLLSGTVVGSVASAFGASWAMSLSHAWLPPYLRTELDMSPASAATLISVISAFSFVLLLAISPVVDALTRRGVPQRWSSGVPQGVAVALAGLAMAGFPFVESSGPRLLLVAVAFGGHAIAFPLHYMTAAAVVPTAQRGALFGIVAATGTLPGLLAPYLTGRFLDNAASRSAGYASSFLLAAVVMLLSGLVAALCVRPERDARRFGVGGGDGQEGEAGASNPLAQ